MGGLCSKKKEKKDGEEEEEDKGNGKCVISPEYMKLLTLIVLMVSDFDIILTAVSCISYLAKGGVFIFLVGFIMFTFCVYLAGCYVAASESGKFLDRFKEKVRLNEISGISMEDLDDALEGRRIFWMGPDFEAAKKRKLSVDNLKAATPDASEPHEIDIPVLEMALREADMIGTNLLKNPGDAKYGEKAIKRANDKLKAAKKAQGGGLKKRPSSKAMAGMNLDDVPDSSYSAPSAKSRDAQEGRGGQSADKPDVTDLSTGDGPVDAAQKMWDDEIKDAEGKGDLVLVQMLSLASIKHMDSYKVDKKLCDKKGRVIDKVRALFMICEAKGILHSYHQTSRVFSRRIVKWSHSMPFYRIMEFGWQPEITHTDFAGILNANALYSFSVGFPQLLSSITVLNTPKTARSPSPCEIDTSTKCSPLEDFDRPSVQDTVTMFSLSCGLLSLVISLVNMILDFPAQVFDIAEKEEEVLQFSLQAEMATKTWEEKLAVEINENIKMMLKMSTQFENNSIPGMEAPGLVIEDVMKLERRAMEKRVAYIEHYLTMSEDEKKARQDLRAGKRKKKKKEEEEQALLEEPEAEIRLAGPTQPIEPPPAVEPVALPPPAVLEATEPPVDLPTEPPPAITEPAPDPTPPPA